MEFGYAKRDIKDLPKDYRKVLERFCKIYEDLPYMCFDVMKGKNGKVYIIESNAQPGVPFDSRSRFINISMKIFIRNLLIKKV
jgi:D-alanine-D-alanine ligase-like ATP-grasp enzyme